MATAKFRITKDVTADGVRTFTYQINGGEFTLAGDPDDPSFDAAYVERVATGLEAVQPSGEAESA